MKVFTGHERATKVHQSTEVTAVIYHQTEVYCRTGNNIYLNNGGWMTVTTKRRMNQAFALDGISAKVYQRNWQWYLHYDGRDIPFNDSKLTLNRKTRFTFT